MDALPRHCGEPERLWELLSPDGCAIWAGSGWRSQGATARLCASGLRPLAERADGLLVEPLPCWLLPKALPQCEPRSHLVKAHVAIQEACAALAWERGVLRAAPAMDRAEALLRDSERRRFGELTESNKASWPPTGLAGALGWFGGPRAWAATAVARLARLAEPTQFSFRYPLLTDFPALASAFPSSRIESVEQRLGGLAAVSRRACNEDWPAWAALSKRIRRHPSFPDLVLLLSLLALPSSEELASSPRPGGALADYTVHYPNTVPTHAVVMWAELGPALLAGRPMPPTATVDALSVADVARRTSAIAIDMLAGASALQALGYAWPPPIRALGAREDSL